MAKRYEGQVPFFLVYVREAHPVDGRQAPRNVRQGILVESAKTLADREATAEICIRKLDIRFPTLVDRMDNQVELAYAGWPDRLYLIGTDGRVVYKSAPGPAGFRPAELEAAIRRTIAAR